MGDECVFCAKVRNGGDEHGPVLPSSDPGTVRFVPLNPVTEGHMLFVPRRHDWHSVNVGYAMLAADAWARRTYEHDAYNLILSHGAAATQTVMHPHVHLVPRRVGDGLPLPWTPVSKVTGRFLPYAPVYSNADIADAKASVERQL